jgi:hypothetical protein
VLGPADLTQTVDAGYSPYIRHHLDAAMDRQRGAAKFVATVSSPAGIYDYLLGGENYSEADRIAAEKAMAIVPEVRFAALENRAFLQRAVRYIAGRGVSQFVDLGSGFPTVGPVHEVAAEIVPDPHVVYVDYDPVVAARSSKLLVSPHTVTVVADLRRPAQVTDDPEVGRVIDWTRPVGVLMVAILHFIADDEDPAGIVATFRERMVPGSYLVISHVSGGENPVGADDAAKIWDRSKSSVTLRTRAQIEGLFPGFELVPPGVVTTTEWGADQPAPTGQAVVLAGVGVVPEPARAAAED